MSQVSNINPTAGVADTAKSNQTNGNGIDSLSQDQFLNLIVTELQNQDPLEPTGNAELLNQVSQLRSLAANDKLTGTLTSFGVTQELTTASSLIGKSVKGVDTKGSEVSGTVSSVSVSIDQNDRNNRKIQVQVSGQTVDIKNIREIVPAG